MLIFITNFLFPLISILAFFRLLIHFIFSSLKLKMKEKKRTKKYGTKNFFFFFVNVFYVYEYIWFLFWTKKNFGFRSAAVCRNWCTRNSRPSLKLSSSGNSFSARPSYFIVYWPDLYGSNRSVPAASRLSDCKLLKITLTDHE